MALAIGRDFAGATAKLLGRHTSNGGRRYQRLAIAAGMLLYGFVSTDEIAARPHGLTRIDPPVAVPQRGLGSDTRGRVGAGRIELSGVNFIWGEWGPGGG